MGISRFRSCPEIGLPEVCGCFQCNCLITIRFKNLYPQTCRFSEGAADERIVTVLLPVSCKTDFRRPCEATKILGPRPCTKPTGQRCRAGFRTGPLTKLSLSLLLCRGIRMFIRSIPICRSITSYLLFAHYEDTTNTSRYRQHHDHCAWYLRHCQWIHLEPFDQLCGNSVFQLVFR